MIRYRLWGRYDTRIIISINSFSSGYRVRMDSHEKTVKSTCEHPHGHITHQLSYLAHQQSISIPAQLGYLGTPDSG